MYKLNSIRVEINTIQENLDELFLRDGNTLEIIGIRLHLLDLKFQYNREIKGEKNA